MPFGIPHFLNKGLALQGRIVVSDEVSKKQFILFVIVISAKSTFTTNTRYHVDSSVDEPHRLQQQVLVYLSFGVVHYNCHLSFVLTPTSMFHSNLI